MYEFRQFYINGQWVDPVTARSCEVINPASESVAGIISMGSPADVDLAVAAAMDNGAIGARLTGGGFGGSAICCIKSAYGIFYSNSHKTTNIIPIPCRISNGMAY